MERPSEETIRKVVDGIATLEETATVIEWFATEEGQMYLSHEMDMRSFNAKEGYEELFVDHEIPSDKISEEIDSVFSSYDGQLSMNFILTQVCTKLEYKSQDHNKIVDKIKAVIKNKVKEGALKLKVGKGGGFSK